MPFLRAALYDEWKIREITSYDKCNGFMNSDGRFARSGINFAYGISPPLFFGFGGNEWAGHCACMYARII